MVGQVGLAGGKATFDRRGPHEALLAPSRQGDHGSGCAALPCPTDRDRSTPAKVCPLPQRGNTARASDAARGARRG
jgi:hypothetical protein